MADEIKQKLPVDTIERLYYMTVIAGFALGMVYLFYAAI